MRIYIIIGLTVFIDQITKMIIRKSMYLGESINVIGGFLRMTFVENFGIAFGIKVSSPFLFTILSLLASIGISIYLFYHRNGDVLLKCALSLIVGGAFGNLIDRLLFGKVVDFIDVGIGGLRWPVFNAADSAVVIGMLILFYTMIISEKIKEKSLNDSCGVSE